MVRATALAILLIATPALAQGDGAEQFGAMFCQASLSGDMAPIEAQLSPELTAILDRALARNAALQAAHPDEKPPLGDGIPWRSWPDYADGCTIGPVRHTATHSGIAIRYSFSQEPSAEYEDVLVVVPAPDAENALRLDDIQYATGNTLRDALEHAFDQ